MRHGGTGMALALVSAATFGTSGTFAASLIHAGWSPAGAVLVRISVAALVLTAPAVRALHGRWAALRRALPTVLLFGVLAVGVAQLCYFDAVQRIPVGVALLLEYLGTVLVVGWVWLRHGQRPRRLTVGGALFAFAGLGLVLDLGGTHHLDPVGVLWGLGAAVGLAAFFVVSAGVDEPLPPLVLAWAGLAVGAATLGLLWLVRALHVRTPAVDVTLLHHRVSWLAPVAGLSIVAAAIAYVAGVAAARLLGARLASFAGLFEVVAAVLFAWVAVGQVPAAVQLAGGALIVAGVALVRVDELRAPQPAPAAERAEPVPAP